MAVLPNVATLNPAAREQAIETVNEIKLAIHEAYSDPTAVEFLDPGRELPTVAVYVLDPDHFGDVGGEDGLDYVCGKLFGLMYGAGFATPWDLIVAAGFEDGGVVKPGDIDFEDCYQKTCAVCHPPAGAPTYTLDDDPIDLVDFIDANTMSLDPEEIHLCRNLMPGGEARFGGGASALFVLRRVT